MNKIHKWPSLLIWWIFLETVFNLAVEIQLNLRSDDHINYIMFPLLLHLSILTKNMTFLWYLQIFRNLNWFKLISCLFVNLSSLCVGTLNLHSWLYQQIKKKCWDSNSAIIMFWLNFIKYEITVEYYWVLSIQLIFIWLCIRWDSLSSY